MGTHFDLFTDFLHCAETSNSLLSLENLRHRMIGRIHHKFSTSVTDTFERSNDLLHKLNVKHGHRQFNVTEITGTVVTVQSVRRTQLAIIQYSHTGIEQTSRNAVFPLIETNGRHLYNRPPPNLIRTHNSELNCCYFAFRMNCHNLEYTYICVWQRFNFIKLNHLLYINSTTYI